MQHVRAGDNPIPRRPEYLSNVTRCTFVSISKQLFVRALLVVLKTTASVDVPLRPKRSDTTNAHAALHPFDNGQKLQRAQAARHVGRRFGPRKGGWRSGNEAAEAKANSKV